MRKNNPLIEDTFHSLLRRKPMSAELVYWTHHFEIGGTLETMRRELVESHEFEFELRQIQDHYSKAAPGNLALQSENLRNLAVAGLPPFASSSRQAPLETTEIQRHGSKVAA